MGCEEQASGGENVVLTSDKTDVAKLGGTDWSKFSVRAKTAFLRKMNIMILQTKQTGGDLGSVVANWLNSKGLRAAVASEITKKSGHTPASTKPQCIISDGTIFRVINTIIACQVVYKATKETHDCENQDSHKPKAAAWDSMANYYNDGANEDLNALLPVGIDALVGTNTPEDYPYSFDALQSGEFEQVVNYINAHYRMARNKKTQKTGHHGTFASYSHGKKWLIYYDALLKEDGNKDLDCFVFPTLPAGAIRTSSSFITPMKRKGIEPCPATRTCGIATASGATIAAMSAMQSRMDGLKETEQRARLSTMKSEMMDWKSKAMECNREYSKLGGMYRAAKSDGKKNKMKEILDERNRLKKIERAYTKEYEQLKEELGYELLTAPQHLFRHRCQVMMTTAKCRCQLISSRRVGRGV